MLSSRLLYDVFVSRVSQTRDNIRGVKGSMLDSHGTRTHDLTDARRACYPLHHVYFLWFTRDNKRGVKGSMLSSRLLDHVFVSRVSQTRDNKRGVKGSMLSSRLLDHVFVSHARRTCYPLHHVYFLWIDSHGTRTHDLTDARRACYPLHHVYCLWFDSHGTLHALIASVRSCVWVPCESTQGI
jgi:hypothetical protein